METFQNIEVPTGLPQLEMMLTKTAELYIIELPGGRQKLFAKV